VELYSNLQIFVPFKLLLYKMIKNTSDFYRPIITAFTFLIGLLLGYGLHNQTGSSTFFENNKNNTIQEVASLIQKKYVDKVELDSITAFGIQEMLSHLDPHSVYISPKELKYVNEEMDGNFCGVGFIYQQIEDSVTITKILKDGPAEKAGLLFGDIILKINDSISLLSKKIDDEMMRKTLRGANNSLVKLDILRDGLAKSISISRGIIPLPSIDASYMIDSVTGYLKINKFAERTYEEFMQSMEGLKKAGLKKLILDIRGNGGGYMHSATAIADEFLDGNKLIVYTKGNDGKKEEVSCQKEGIFETGSLTVLIDENTASASEVLAGSLQDWDRATIVGRRSFGKGLVQQQYNLSDGGALRLTVARYYTPLGRNIQKSYSQGKTIYKREIEDRFIDGELLKGVPDSIINKTNIFKTPKGNFVYGGGGITPNVYQTIDTSTIKKIKIELLNSYFLPIYVHQYIKQNYDTLKNLKTTSQLSTYFKITNKQVKEIALLAKKEDIETNLLPNSELEFIIKLLITKELWDVAASIQLQNTKDTMVLKAIKQ
jgi:carboxyl-terminal processing protease